MNATTLQREFVSRASATAMRNGAGFNPCQGLYVAPADSQPDTVFIATHYNVDFSEHYLGEYLAQRGFGFLGWNTRFRGNEAFFLLEHALIDIGAGVEWLRHRAGVKRIVLIGNSGGGSLMGAYQSQASTPNITATHDLKLPDAVNQLNAADLYISLNAHGGRPEVLTDWMDPSVIDENDPTAIDQSLNMYNAANGPPFADTFVEKYRDAQKQRNKRITDWVKTELVRVAEHGQFDRAFVMQRTWADLRLLDARLDPSERPIGVCYAGDPKRANFSPRGIGLTNTLRTWLSMWSLETSQCSAIQHLPNITVPSLVIQSTADTGVFPSDAQRIYDLLGTANKELHLVPGDHYLTEPENARADTADLIARWVGSQ